MARTVGAKGEHGIGNPFFSLALLYRRRLAGFMRRQVAEDDMVRGKVETANESLTAHTKSNVVYLKLVRRYS